MKKLALNPGRTVTLVKEEQILVSGAPPAALPSAPLVRGTGATLRGATLVDVSADFG